MDSRNIIVAQLDSIIAATCDLKQQVAVKDARITALETEFNTFKQDADSQLSSVASENSALKRDVTQKDQRVASLEHENSGLKRDLAQTMWTELTDRQREEVKRFAQSLRAPPAVPAPPPAFQLPPAAVGPTYLNKFAATNFSADQLLLMHWGSGVRSFVYARSWPHATTADELHLQTVVVLGAQPGFTTIPFDRVSDDLTVVTASTAVADCAAVFDDVNLDALFRSDIKVFDRSLGMIMLPFEQYANTVKMQSVKAVLAVSGVTKSTMKLQERRVSANALTQAWVDSLFQDSVAGGARVLAAMAGTSSSACSSEDDVEDEVEDEDVVDVDAVKVESGDERFDLNN